MDMGNAGLARPDADQAADRNTLKAKHRIFPPIGEDSSWSTLEQDQGREDGREATQGVILSDHPLPCPTPPFPLGTSSYSPLHQS